MTARCTARVAAIADHGVVRARGVPGRLADRAEAWAVQPAGGARSRTLDRTGSVYSDLIVPDFGRAPLSMSGVVLAATGMSASEAHVASALIAPAPTTRREFAAGEAALAAVRVYQGGRKPVEAATIRARILDAADRTVFSRDERLAADDFRQRRAADYRLPLPLDRLPSGSYVLTLEAAIGSSRPARRDVRFSVAAPERTRPSHERTDHP